MNELLICRTSRWWGRFWERRYSAIPILDDGALEDRLRYVVSHGIKEGIVAAAREWEGLHCAEHLVGGRSVRFQWFDWTKRWNAKNRPGFAEGEVAGRYSSEFSQEEVLELVPLPQWAELALERQRELACQLVKEEEDRHKRPSVLGMAAAKREHMEPPEARKRSPRPWCHATSLETHGQYRRHYRAFESSYRAASMAWLKGDTRAEFPETCFKPFVSNTGCSARPSATPAPPIVN